MAQTPSRKKKKAKKKAQGRPAAAAKPANTAAKSADADVNSLDDASARSFEDLASVRSSLSVGSSDRSSSRDGSGSDRDEDEDDFSSESEEEEVNSYKPGGYHPVKVRPCIGWVLQVWKEVLMYCCRRLEKSTTTASKCWRNLVGATSRPCGSAWTAPRATLWR